LDQGDVIIIALVLIVPALLLWGLFLSRSGRPRSPARTLGIPQAMRPGSPDEVLEGRRLQRIQVAGLLATVGIALFIPMYWLPEADRQESFQERFDEESVARGKLIYQAPPPLEEDADPAAFREEERAISLGQACINCHAAEGAGGPVPNGFADPATGENVQYQAPPLNNVFTRWDEEIVRFTIERGRPGTPMPAWGVEFGGSMTSQMITDVIAYLRTLEGNQTGPEELPSGCDDPSQTDFMRCGQAIFETRCAVCHGPQGQGKDDDPYYQGMALWNGKVEHLTEAQHEITVVNGRRFAFMPGFAEAPSQGLPIPPYPLTEAQIQAVMEYERSL
jgi:mono/diheme cytochrome c family protein